jgi:hypothetical protein
LNVKLVIAAAVAVAVVGVLVAIYAQGQPTSGLAGQTFTQGAFAVTITEDTDRRLVAKIKNNGATLDNAGAFLVKRSFDSNCQPQDMVMANFQLADRDGALVANPDTLLEDATVTIDSQQSNINKLPMGSDVEITAYILRLQPNSVQVADLLQEIPLQKPNTIQVFEDCLNSAGKGFPLQIRVLNPQANSTSYFTIKDMTGKTYESSLLISQDLPEDFDEIFWPNEHVNWMSANFTRAGGPAPEYSDPPLFSINVKTTAAGETRDFGSNIALRQDDLHEYSFDYVNVITGKSVPAYPKYWEVIVDMRNGSIS